MCVDFLVCACTDFVTEVTFRGLWGYWMIIVGLKRFIGSACNKIWGQSDKEPAC